MFKKIYAAALTTAKIVIPAKAGIQRNTGFPRIKHLSAAGGKLSQARNDRMVRSYLVAHEK